MTRRTVKLGVSRRDGLFRGARQRREVISVREACGLNRLEDSDPCAPRKEQFGAGSRNAIRTFDDHRQHREPCVDRNAKRPLLERQEFLRIAPGSFRKHDQGVSAFGSELNSFVDGCPGGPASFPIDLNHANPSHGYRYQGDAKQFLLGQEPSFDGEKPEQQRDVVRREVVRDDHVACVRIDVLDPFHAELHWWETKEGSGPPLDDSSVDRRRWSKHSVHDDERRVDQCENEKQWDEDKCPHSCGQCLEHVGSVDEMDNVAS